MKDLSDLINSEKDNRSVFIFPSETAAVQWRIHFLNISGRKAVRNDRFLSWDKFKEQITLHDRNEKPVNSVLRKFFSYDLVKRNSTELIFERLIPQQFREYSSAFSELICRSLPELNKLLYLFENNHPDIDPELQGDYKKLHAEYLEFMKVNGLFEPSWELPETAFPDKSFFILYPELIEDFGEYRQLLTEAGCKFIRKKEGGRRKIRQFENSVIEADRVLLEITRALDSGIGFSDIAVTCADEETAELLREGALLKGLPLNFRSGKTLADYPAGKLPVFIRSCFSEGFSIRSMKNLLLFRGFRWLEQEKASSLIRFGIENRCLKNVSPSTRGDVWAYRLKSAGRYDLLDFYKKLKSRINAMNRCRSFAELSRELQVFISAFLDTESENWEPDLENVFQRTREVLAELRKSEEELKGVKPDDPLSFWIEMLKEKIYVKQQAESGIPVYPYRVSALIYPKLHFITGLSHDRAAVSSKPFSFLTDKIRKDLEAEELNMTDDFIDLYSFSGEDVRFSCASETLSGTELAPGLFIERNLVERVSLYADSPELRSLPVTAENLWWSSPDFLLPGLGSMQLEGFSYAADIFMQDREFNAADKVFPAGEILSLLDKEFTGEDGNIRISASALNSWSVCRFNFFLSWALGIAEDEYILKPEDPLTAGNIMHEILYLFFRKLSEQNRVFSSGEQQEYLSMIENSAVEVFSRWEKEENFFFGPAWPALKRKVKENLSLFPQAESIFCDGCRPLMLEKRLEFDMKGQNVKAVGMVDRISQNEDGAVIVDYKKSWKKKTRARFISEGEDGLLPPEQGYQLPFYIVLAEAAGLKVSGTSYYGIEQGKHFPVSGKGGVLSEDDVKALCELTVSSIGKMADSIRSGDFTAARQCEGCSYRSVCRKRFNVNWSGR